MIRRIELCNFMSHAHTVLEPAEGLTVLVGPNNCGKSAIVEALRILCTNDRSNYVTRHGEREASVTVETNDGHVIEWRRSRRGSVRYTIDGQTFDRLRSAVPEKLHEMLRLPQVETDGENDNSFDIHFGEQKRPIFLLDRPGSHAAQFFASSSDAHKLIEMQALHRQKVHDAKQTQKRLKQDAQKQAETLKKLAPVPSLDQRLKELEADHEAMQTQAQILTGLQAHTHALGELMNQRDHLRALQTSLTSLTQPPVLEAPQPLTSLITHLRAAVRAERREQAVLHNMRDLSVPPPLDDTQRLAGQIRALRTGKRNCERLDASQRTLQALSSPPQPEDAVALAQLIQQLHNAGRRRQTFGAQQTVLQGCPTPPGPEDEAALARCLTALDAAQRSVERWSQAHARLDTLPEAPPLEDPLPLTQLLCSFTEAHGQIEQLEQQVKKANEAAAEAEDVLRRFAVEQDTCPTCGAALDPDQLIDQAVTGTGGHVHA